MEFSIKILFYVHLFHMHRVWTDNKTFIFIRIKREIENGRSIVCNYIVRTNRITTFTFIINAIEIQVFFFCFHSGNGFRQIFRINSNKQKCYRFEYHMHDFRIKTQREVNVYDMIGIHIYRYQKGKEI